MDDQLLEGREVRLFPTAHISSTREAELRAAASFLAMVRAVSEFGRKVLSAAGAPKGRQESFTEVPFRIGDPLRPKTIRPDGLIRVSRGKTDWRALVEVKVGDCEIEQDQLDAYHTLAVDQGLACVITISNQAAQPNGLPPLPVDRRRLKKCALVHLSWERLLSEAKLLSRLKAVDDPDQEWMLEEWIRYVADPASKIIEAPHLGENWAKVLKAARDGHLTAVGREITDVARHWDAFQRKTCLSLRAKLGVEVRPKISRAERDDAAQRIQAIQSTVEQTGELASVFRVPDAAGDITLRVMLPARSVRYAISVRAPDEGRTKTRVNWLVRQLKKCAVSDGAMISVRWSKRRILSQARLADAVENVEHLLRDGHGAPIPPECEPIAFDVELTDRLPKPRGRSSAPVLTGLTSGLEKFYIDVVQGLRPFVPSAPRLESRESKADARQGADHDTAEEPGSDHSPPPEEVDSASPKPRPEEPSDSPDQV